MDVTITTRHCTIPDVLQDRTRRRFGRLVRFHPRATSASVVFEEDRGRKRCEAKLHIDGGPPLFASADEGSFRAALDTTQSRLERQLPRQRARRRRRDADVARTG